MPGYANPQNLNRFSYVYNNPIIYTDPTGHCGGLVGVLCLIGVTTIAVVGSLTIANYLIANPPSEIKGWNKINGLEKIQEITSDPGLFYGNKGSDPDGNAVCKLIGKLGCAMTELLILGAAVACGASDQCGRILQAKQEAESMPTPTLTSTPTQTPRPTQTSTPTQTPRPRPPIFTPRPPIFMPAPSIRGGRAIPI